MDIEDKCAEKIAVFVTQCELCGINIINSDENITGDKAVIKFSIPEFFSVNNEKVSEAIGKVFPPIQVSQQEMIDYVKNGFYEISADGDEIDDDLKSMFKFLCKVRKGETWNEESVINKIKELEEAKKKIEAEKESWSEV